MVRIIDLIMQGMNRKKEKQKWSNKPEYPNLLGRVINEELKILKQQDTIAIKPGSLLFGKEEKKYYYDLYFEVLNVASLFLDKVVRGDKIDKTISDGVIAKVVEAFDQDLYNELLLLTYSLAEENYLSSHIVNDTILTVAFSKSLGFSRDELASIGTYAFFHDMGMAYFSVLYNKNARPSLKEFEYIKKHPIKTLDICDGLFSLEGNNVIADVHERENGQGYPNGKKGYEINPWAKIIAICDVYEALTHLRPFRGSYSPFEAIKIIVKMKHNLLDINIIKKFIEFLSIYPVGSWVYLSTGELAVVVGGEPTFAYKIHCADCFDCG